MNIRDADNAPAALRIDPTTVRNNPRRAEKTRPKQTENQVRAGREPDEFIQADFNVSPSALYSISDVRRGRFEQSGNRFQGRRSVLGGEKVAEKVVDIILSPGIKMLSIFRTEE